LKKVKFCLATIATITGANEAEIYKAEGIDDLLHDIADPWKTLRHFEEKISNDTVQDLQDVPGGVQDGRDCQEAREKEVGKLVRLLKFVGLQLHAVTQNYFSLGKEKNELSTKASQEGVLRKTKAKVEKLRQGHEVEVSYNKIEAYDEMVKDAFWTMRKSYLNSNIVKKGTNYLKVHTYV